jgi:glycerol kinase
MTYVLAIDQGTTNTKAVLVDGAGSILARASSPLTTAYPQNGWAEQSAADIWASVQAVIADLVGQAEGDIKAIAIANQRETLVTWDADTGQPIHPAIIWQCRRTAEVCARMIAAGHDADVVAATGLGINPLFPASKLGWVMRHVPEAKALADKGTLRAGTVDAWLLWNLTGGASFATDHSNASRTQLFDTEKLAWSDHLCTLFGAPITALPQPMPSDSHFGVTADTTALRAGVPILAMMGDSHAALYGHGIRAPGTVKATYGTGSSLMTLTPGRVASSNGLSGTIAWTDRQGTAYALEGNITVSAQAAAFMARLLGMSVQALSDLAQTVTDSAGVAFVPALAGLGAPHWDDHATGMVTGMTHGTLPAHLARATFEAIAAQIADVLAAMERDMGQPLHALRADGGASANPFLMQLQADILQRPVLQSPVEEVGALGAAAMAFAHLGHVMPLEQSPPTRFEPGSKDRALAQVWAQAVARAKARV